MVSSILWGGRWMPVLLLVASLVSAATALGGQHAAILYLRGDVTAARDETTAVLAKSPAGAPALFVRACLELESAGPVAADPFVTRLERLPSPPPQAAVLRKLVARRRSAPSEPIYDALGEAWKDAGRPDLSSVALLPPLESWMEDLVPPLPSGPGTPSPQERLVFTWAMPPERLKVALQAAEQAEANPLVVDLEILAAVMPRKEVPSGQNASRVAERVGRIVTAADASNGYLAVAAWLALGEEDQPISDGDLATLEAAVSKPRFEVPRRTLLEQLRSMAARVTPQYSELRARSASLATAVPIFHLWKRAEATKDPALRRRAGLVMGVIASRFACSGTVLERMLSAALAGKAAALTGLLGREEIRIALEPLDAWRRSMSDAQKRLGTWPFSGPFREMDVTSEVPRFERLVGPMPTSGIPAFSCQTKGEGSPTGN
jgi:hypothetical protein